MYFEAGSGLLPCADVQHPAPLTPHTRMPLPSLWGHHKDLQQQDKASALRANWCYLCAQQVEERAWSCTHVHRGREGLLGQHKERSPVEAAGCLVCCRLRPTGWAGIPQITRGSAPTPPALKNFILPKKLPGKLQPPGQWSSCSGLRPRTAP